MLELSKMMVHQSDFWKSYFTPMIIDKTKLVI
jgi:hypothetical protein